MPEMKLVMVILRRCVLLRPWRMRYARHLMLCSPFRSRQRMLVAGILISSGCGKMFVNGPSSMKVSRLGGVRMCRWSSILVSRRARSTSLVCIDRSVSSFSLALPRSRRSRCGDSGLCLSNCHLSAETRRKRHGGKDCS